MNKKLVAMILMSNIVVAFSVVLIMNALNPVRANAETKIRWQYGLIPANSDGNDSSIEVKVLSKSGAEGWELVSDRMFTGGRLLAKRRN